MASSKISCQTTPSCAMAAPLAAHLGDFLAVLSVSCRESCLPALADMHADAATRTEWRARVQLVRQLPRLSTLFSTAATVSVVVPIALSLLRDGIYMVREEALLAMPALVNRLGSGRPPAPSNSALCLMEDDDAHESSESSVGGRRSAESESSTMRTELSRLEALLADERRAAGEAAAGEAAAGRARLTSSRSRRGG